MFGLGGFGGYGGGGNNRNNRYSMMRRVRIIAVLALLLLGTALHHQGSAYTTLRFLYYGVILSGIAYSIYTRRARQAGMRSGAATSAPSVPAQPGWYPEPGSSTIQRYWDGVAWGSRRRWDGNSWVLE